MAKKNKTVYVCSNCGEEFSRWQGRCFSCGEWETIREFKIPKSKNSRRPARNSGENRLAEALVLSDVRPDENPRIDTGLDEINRVLGSGIVPGSLTLFGGSPGIGKSTLLLQLASMLSDREMSVLYASGEESSSQISMRAQRLGCKDSVMLVLAENNLDNIINVLQKHSPSIIIIDSIQTMFTEDIESAPGSVSQVRECASILMRYGKENNCSIFLIGHVTKEGAIAGPRVLEHMVDTVLYLEGDQSYQYRILRVVKNRFGPAGEIALLEMSNSGLHEIRESSGLFCLNREKPLAGTAFVPVLEGSRTIVVELQALVNQSHFGLPQRVASGINPKKLSLILAVLERFAGLSLGDHDVFLNVTGGLSITEPAVDLGICASLISSFRNQPIRKGLAFTGEIGLGGEIRPVNSIPSRLKELAAMGFSECLLSKDVKKKELSSNSKNVRIVTCDNLSRLDESVF